MASMSTARFFTVSSKTHSPKPHLEPTKFRTSVSLGRAIPSLNLTKIGCGKTVIRAVEMTTTSAFRRRRSAESEKLPTDVLERAMDAIDSSGRRVTIGDVMVKSGLKLDEAQKALGSLTVDTYGFLEMSDDGDVLYVLSKDYRTKLPAKWFRIRIESLWYMGKMAAVWLTKVFFGTAMMLPVILPLLFVACLAPRFRLLHFFRKKGYEDDSVNNSSKAREAAPNNVVEFLETFYSFVYGADNHQRIEEERWKMIGHYIASNGGVVAAEELAPYLDLKTTEKMDDESYILPVLQRFNGRPDVDKKGNILYRFPLLQRTAIPQNRWADWVGEVEMVFKEKKFQVSSKSHQERVDMIAFGIYNLLWATLLDPLLEYLGYSPFRSTLKICAGSFLVIAFIRQAFTAIKNGRIWARNNARKLRARALESPDLSLSQKVSSARNMARRTFIGEDKIVYSTEGFARVSETQEWNAKFKERWDFDL